MEMKMKQFLRFACAGLLLTVAPLLHADSISFNVTTAGHSFSFTLPSQQAPDQSGKDFEGVDFFFYNNIAVTADGVTKQQGVLFLDEGDQFVDIGSAWFVTAQGLVAANNFFEGFLDESQKIFSGPDSSPTFLPGSVSGFYLGLGPESPTATIDIRAVAQTPEPDSFVLLGSGLLGVAGFVRRRILTRS
jgi:PEP-CTERM motif